MSIPLQHNIGAYLRSEPIFTASAALTLSSNTSTEITGRIIDRLALGRDYLSVKIVVPYSGNFQSSLGLLLRGRLKDSSSTSGTFATFGTTSTGLDKSFATTTTATSTSHCGVAEWDFDLRTAKRFLQFDLLPVLVASSSGGVSLGGAAIFGGALELPPVAPVDRATTS